MPIHIILIVLFVIPDPGPSLHAQEWRWGIITSHSIMMALVSSSWLAARQLSRHTSSRLVEVLTVAISFSYFAFGAIVSGIDQYVTIAITPIVMTSTGIGMLLLLRPI